MKLEDEILINMYGQDLIQIEDLVLLFKSLEENKQKMYLIDILNLIVQSKPLNSDIEKAINLSNLKATFTPCVMLHKGVEPHLLLKITQLPSHERNKVFVLFLSLFKIAYQRRFNEEQDHPGKWWYWDLSKEENIKSIQDESSEKTN